MEIETLLKQSKKSITQERMDIFEFIKMQHIFGAQDIRNAFPKMGRASIFRSINLFLELGVIRRIPFSDIGETYEFNDTGHHHEHMKCEKCQQIMSFASTGICKRIFEEAHRNGFIIKEHSISIFGICKKCSLS